MIKVIVLVVLFGVSMQLGLTAQGRHLFAITPHQVAQAFQRQGLDVVDSQVALAARIVSSSEDPVLEVEAVQGLAMNTGSSRGLNRFRIVCLQTNMCIPFYAVVAGGSEGSVEALRTIGYLADPAPRKIVDHASVLPISMHAGSHVTLLIDSGLMHIRVAVVCLQDGAIGARVTVASVDRKQSYHAIVLSPDLLSGGL